MIHRGLSMEHYLIDVGSPMIDDRRSEDSEPATLHLDSAMCIIYIPPQDIRSFNASAFVLRYETCHDNL